MEEPLVGEVDPSMPRLPGSVAFMWRLNDILMTGSIFGEVKGPFTIRQCVNLHKLLVLPICLSLVRVYGGDLSLRQQWGPAAAVLLACHSAYGFFSVYTDIYFPRKEWQPAQSILGFVVCFAYPLGVNYLPIFCVVSRQCPVGYFANGDEPWLLGVGLMLYITGFFYHFCGEICKNVQLKYQEPQELITTGLMAHCRNPHHFGEVFSYLGLAVLSTTWFCIPVFVVIWLQTLLPNLLGKEVSLAQYEDWEDWHARTGFLFPWLPALLSDVRRNALSRMPKVE